MTVSNNAPTSAELPPEVEEVLIEVAGILGDAAETIRKIVTGELG